MEVGNSSVKDICNMIPAIKANKSPKITSFMMGNRNKYVIIAPNGSDKAEAKV